MYISEFYGLINANGFLQLLHRLSLIILVCYCTNANILAQEKTLRFKQLTIEDGLPQNTVHGIIKDKLGFMWFCTTGGLSRYDGYKLTNYYTDPNNPNSLINNRALFLFKDDSGNIWVSFMDAMEICRYNYESDDFTRFSKDSVPKFIADTLDKIYNNIQFNVQSNEYLWYVKRWQADAQNWYLNQVNELTGNHMLYLDSQCERWAINDKLINYAYLDDAGILWLGTYSGGVNISDTKAKSFCRYTNSSDVKYYIIDNFTRAICEDNKGNLWIGTYKNGITRINRKTNSYDYFIHKEKGNSLIDNSIRKIYCDSYGFIWIGTKGGLDRFDPETNTFHHYATFLDKKIPNDWVFAIVEDLDRNLWIGTFKGIAKYNRNTDSFYAYEPEGTLNHQSVRALHVDKKNNLWVATEGGGITHLERPQRNIFKENLLPAYYKFSNTDLNVNRVYSITEDENGILWIGTSGGMVRFDPSSNDFKILSMKDGFLSNAVVAVLSDLKGHIWFSHKRGLSRLDISTLKIRNYSLNDGLQSLEFSEDAYFKNNSTGEMFFGGIGGFNTFFPDSIKDNPYVPEVVITELKVFNEPVLINQSVHNRIILTKSITLTHEIELSHRDKSFTIEFAALHYTDPKSNQYLYKLEGYDKQWIATDAGKRFATYANLPPRTYTFQVKASNSDGIWNQNPTLLKIVILPAWYQTWWFILICVVAIIAVIFGGYYLRLAYYRIKEAELTAIVKERTSELEKSNKFIKEQSDKLLTYSEKLKEINELLIDKQKKIIEQSEQLLENNEQLTVLNKTKDKLFSIIGHDLRNPFNVISGFSELLLASSRNFSKEKKDMMIQHIHRASKGGNILLENLLQWSRAQSGKIIFEPVSENLYSLVKETIDLLESEADRKKISILNRIDQTLLIEVDENMAKTVIRNLLSNAIKFTYEGGKITFNAHPRDSFVEVSISDTGTGMPANRIPTLFNLETTISQKGTTDETGTGLGLFLCKEFVTKHGGEIWVESEVGKGSTFRFTFPAS